MHDAVDDCSVVLQQGTTSTLSRNSRGETKRGKMDQSQTRFEESAVFAVIVSVWHQDPLGYANNHSQKQNGQIRELPWNRSTAVHSRFWRVAIKKTFSVKSKNICRLVLSYLFRCMTRYQGHQSMSIFLIFQKLIKKEKQQKNHFLAFHIRGRKTW